MIVLDTNVVSEPMKPHGSPAVRDWLDDQVAETLYLTSTGLSELLMGIEMSPDGKRNAGLSSALSQLIERLFGSRILAFDQRAATEYPSRVRRARTTGHVISMADGQVAAIAAVHGFAVATRDTTPFAAAGLPVINPWETGSSSGSAKPGGDPAGS